MRDGWEGTGGGPWPSGSKFTVPPPALFLPLPLFLLTLSYRMRAGCGGWGDTEREGLSVPQGFSTAISDTQGDWGRQRNTVPGTQAELNKGTSQTPFPLRGASQHLPVQIRAEGDCGTWWLHFRMWGVMAMVGILARGPVWQGGRSPRVSRAKWKQSQCRLYLRVTRDHCLTS